MISTEMATHNITVCQAKDDGDTLIVKVAIDLVVGVNSPVVVVAQDTDILILLCYHRPINCMTLYLQADFDGLYDISTIDIGDREEFLFKYGWSGNDTVSCIHGHTKYALYKCKFPASVITAITSNTSTVSEIQTAGIKDALWWYCTRQSSQRNLLHLQGRRETMSNNEMQLQEGWHVVCICMWSVLWAL